MSSIYGENIHISIFGQSHSAAIGVAIDGIPAGLAIDTAALNAFMRRRAPGQNEYSTARREADEPEFLSGIADGHTCGAPIAAIIRNTDTRSRDYDPFRFTPRPGHADYTADIKYRGFEDRAGGGHFSGRLTAPLCIAGGICIQLLQQQGISIMSRIASIGSVHDAGELIEPTADKPFPTVSDAAGEAMRREIAAAKAEGDSVGGVLETAVVGLPAGIGEPWFGGVENVLSSALFAVPAVKGVEFGAGFALANMRGSAANDEFFCSGGKITTATNNNGGINGGITNGMPVVFRCAVKPTPTIHKEQNTVDFIKNENVKITAGGRHDPCIVHRARVVIDSITAIALCDMLAGRFGTDWLGE